MEKYTFLLPAYKAAFFEEALTSIKNQTFKDFLCIVSDDCSPEDLKSIFDRVCGNDKRFSYRRNEKNMGGKNLVTHWNLLMDLCETEYFMMAGDDDIYHPEFLSEVDKLQIKYPDAGVIRARSQYINKNGEITDQDSLFPEYQDSLTFLFNRFNSSYISGILNYAFRKDAMRLEKQFSEFPVAWFSDEASVIACSKYGICTTADILTSMRISGINISCQHNSAISRQKIEASIKFKEWVVDFINSNCRASTILDRNRLEFVNRNIRKFILMSLLNYSKDLSLCGRVQLYNRLKSLGFFESKGQRARYLVLVVLKMQ